MIRVPDGFATRVRFDSLRDGAASGRQCQYAPEDFAAPGAAFAAAPPPEASYLDGHFAITPLGSTANPCGPRVPFTTTSASDLNVSGTMPR